MATGGKAFNYGKFGKLVRLFDSDSIGERDVAVMQALKQCREHEPRVLFWEAAGTVFGSFSQGEVDRLEERAVAAETEAKNQRQAAERAAEEARRQKEAGARLTAENARLTEDMQRVARGGFEWPDIALLRPGVLQLPLSLVVAAEWVAIMPLGRSWLGGDAPFVAEWIRVLGIALFVLWSAALYKCGDWGDLLSGWIAWAVWWAFVVFAIAISDAGFRVGTAAFNQMLVPYCWWGTMGAPFTEPDCWIVLFALGLVVDTNLGWPIWRMIGSVVAAVVIGAIEAVENVR